MTVQQRTFAGKADLQAMSDLSHRFPRENLHLTDLPYRLSSWGLDEVENIGLWQDGSGELTGWAVLQTPFWSMDYAYDPGLHAQMHPRILAWADERARQALSHPSGRPSWFVNVFDRQTERMVDLEAAGYVNQDNAGEDAWSKVFMTMPSQVPTHPVPGLPKGFQLRPLAGQQEVAAYVELHRLAFGTENMTEAWRRRVLMRQEYKPELDLVVEAPDGRLAAFCVGWFDPVGRAGRPEGQIEPMGVREEYRGLGLGRAILGECLRGLRALGAGQIWVETDNFRDAAMGLYEAAGFQVVEKVLVYRKDYAPL